MFSKTDESSVVGGKSALRVGEEGGEALVFLETQPISFHFGVMAAMIGLVITGSTRHYLEVKTESRERESGTTAASGLSDLVCIGLHVVLAANGR